MNIQIRPYSSVDKEACLVAFTSNVPQYFTPEEIKEFTNFLQKFDQNSGPENTHYFVIRIEDQIIGCGGFGDRFNDQIISLAWGLIHQDYHRKGYGKILLLYRLEQIKQLYPNMPVVIDTTQFSAPFFERYGFQTDKITPDYYAKGMHRHDMTLVPNTEKLA